MQRLSKAALVISGVLASAFAALPGTAETGAKQGTKSEPSVEIAGPGQVHPSSSCTWTAFPTDIAGPYQYYWSTSEGDQGTGQNFTTQADRFGFVIWVTVHGSNGEAYAERTIGVSPNGQQCF